MCRIVPLPTDEHFWILPELRIEANRSFLLRYTHLLTRHFAAAAFSVDCRSDRASDAVRLVTATMLVVFTDRLCRIVSTDTPSLFARHYSGRVEGPVLPFVLDAGVFAEESSYSLLLWPELSTARASALEYFQTLQTAVVDDHRERQQLFQFDVAGVKVGPAETQLIEQLGLNLGLGGTCREYVPQLLSGEMSDVLDHCPELGWLRDVVFLSKIVLNSNGEKLPNPSRKGYRSSDARLQWRVEKGKITVEGFGMKNLDQCAGYSKDDGAGVSRANKMRHMIDQWKKKGKCRSVPSMANPSTLCDGNEETHSEEDVLYLKHLPDFDGALSPSQIERILAILTAPYVRIPLLLAFFSDRDRCGALANPRLQMVLDAALYEPGRWTSTPQSTMAFKIPGPVENTYTRDGLLMNELLHCPEQIAVAVGDLVDAAAERDTGRDTAPSQRCILYAARLVARVCIYVGHVSELYSGKVEGEKMDECMSILRSKLTGKIWSIVSRWCESSMRKRRYEDANCAHAHLLLLAAARGSFEMDDEETSEVYETVLKAQVYLSMHHSWSDSEIPSGVLGGIYNVEVMNVFTLFRRPIYLRLRADQTWASGVLEEVVEMVSSSNNQSASRRLWEEQSGLLGVFIPQSDSNHEEKGEERPYVEWLRGVTQPPALTINVNLGRITLKQHQLSTLPEWALQFPDFAEVFGEETTTESIQAYVVISRDGQ
ncbi:hypothetical protein Pmar_PMAR028393 [Perkinsus marinus ATCC 50983]|uniref:ubiquitinyl hydrolase 1 n=1 Tax=Perkinsus marinus (strain ATCC 50983 / TXsc) TaxID=423536 RepID=C5M097_PERM5|nr:hypothetical protein Pmar_PMAR028393 [Perkinsus marinus ATCC 50983]EEQ97586.1 hypothetical protein Pmar_PMAR028393 [Perkinsus marinus ATCC 50983]|eukprot:XP_002764869.1 hypothetical protein Pmar_PMAR028393 [Perkinsus marinus ATCC 50983]